MRRPNDATGRVEMARRVGHLHSPHRSYMGDGIPKSAGRPRLFRPASGA